MHIYEGSSIRYRPNLEGVKTDCSSPVNLYSTLFELRILILEPFDQHLSARQMK